MKAQFLFIAAMLSMPASAFATPAAVGEEARIAFPNNATIRTFRAENRETVYIQDRARRWYRAQVIGPCLELPYARAIGVDTRGSRVLDRFSALIVERERCQLISFVRVAGPPERRRR
nr:DUF6491 family protein [uncultured Sphingosinicella sp.]